MTEPHFDSEGIDQETFAPLVLIDGRHSEWKDKWNVISMSFSDWGYRDTLCGEEFDEPSTLNGYYLNGPGIEGLVKACRLQANLDPEPEEIFYDSEGGACFIRFSTLEDALQTAELASAMFQECSRIAAMIEVAREHGFEYG